MDNELRQLGSKFSDRTNSVIDVDIQFHDDNFKVKVAMQNLVKSTSVDQVASALWKANQQYTNHYFDDNDRFQVPF